MNRKIPNSFLTGIKNDLTNEIVGTFKGPGRTGIPDVIQFTKQVVAQYMSFQIKKKSALLQIQGIKFNEKPVLGKQSFVFFYQRMKIAYNER